MMSAPLNIIRKRIAALLLVAIVIALSPAQSGTYRDTSGMPMVQMMLLMMDMMGMLNRVPYGYDSGWPAYAPFYSAAAPFGGGYAPNYYLNKGMNPDLNAFPPAQSFSPGENWGMGIDTVENPWEPLPSATGSNFGLNGIWQGEAGDMVAIYGNRFMWSGRGDRSLSGQLKVDGEYLLMGVPSTGAVQIFRVQAHANGGFTVMGRNGQIMRFRRLY